MGWMGWMGRGWMGKGMIDVRVEGGQTGDERKLSVLYTVFSVCIAAIA